MCCVYVWVCVRRGSEALVVELVVCVCVTVQAEEEPGVGPYTYTLASSQALCVCVLFMPLLRRCAVWNKGPIWALLLPEAARFAATAAQSSE